MRTKMERHVDADDCNRHGSLARAGKVKSQTPKVRALERLPFTRTSHRATILYPPFLTITATYFTPGFKYKTLDSHIPQRDLYSSPTNHYPTLTPFKEEVVTNTHSNIG